MGEVIQVLKDRFEMEPYAKKFGITVSVGAAEFDPDEMATVNDVLRAADADMYDSKLDGERETEAVG